MTTADSESFASRLAGLAEVFDVKLSAMRQALYFEALRDIDFPDIALALNQAVKSCRFFPKPVEIRELAIGSSAQLAEEAWIQFKDEMTVCGAYERPSWKIDSVMGLTIQALFSSWSGACRAEFTNYTHKEFTDTYQRFLASWDRHVRTNERARLADGDTATLPSATGKDDVRLLR